MLAIKTNHISNLNLLNSRVTNKSYRWLNMKSVNTPTDLTTEYRNICNKFRSDNKWVLMVNPENDSLDQLASSRATNGDKVLRVYSNKVNVNIENIETALSKGNCSVIVLCNASFNEAELTRLNNYAKQGKTQCIILKSKTVIH